MRIDVHLDPAELRSRLIDDARLGLTSTPKDLPPKWFYDDVGSQLFDEITRLDEYYPTETERSILTDQGDTIAKRSGADTLVELGSGTSDKTPALLDAMKRGGLLGRYVPFDVSEQTLRDAAGAIEANYPGIDVHGVVGDFDHHLPLIPTGGRRLIAFLGGTIGNYTPRPRRRLLHDIVSVMVPGDHLLLGTDLVKDARRLVAAYDDRQGVTAEFNRNVLRVLNAELDADFDPDAFSHVAIWDATNEWIEMRLRSTVEQQVSIGELQLEIEFAADEEMRTEVSAKFRREGIDRELAAVGLEVVEWLTDPNADFALSLSTLVA